MQGGPVVSPPPDGEVRKPGELLLCALGSGEGMYPSGSRGTGLGLAGSAPGSGCVSNVHGPGGRPAFCCLIWG